MFEPFRKAMATLARSVEKGPGPVKWCNRCSRKHGSRVPCDLISVAVEAKSGRMVRRYIHPERASDA